jgi:hypothetical protein
MRRHTFAAVILMLCPLIANAAKFSVNCNAPGPLSKISNVLKVVNPKGPNTITISGTCHENLFIEGFDRLTLIAKPGAVLTDASGGQEYAVVYIVDSRRISIQGFTIMGGNAGVACSDYSLCRFSGNTFQGATQRGVDINDSDATFSGDVIQNNSDIGLFINASHVQGWNLVIQGNSSGVSATGSRLVGTGWSVHNNTHDGVFVNSSSNFQLIDSNVSSNGGNGIAVTALTNISMTNDTVTGNGFFGVWFGDESVGFFVGGNYSGNTFRDIACGGQYSIASNIAGIYGTTDCPVPQPPAVQTQQK